MAALKPKLIIIDSIVSRATKPLLVVARETTAKKGNSIAQFDNQKVVQVAHVSLRAMRIMAASAGYSVQKIPWKVPRKHRKWVNDYYSKFGTKVRLISTLRRSVS